jgi:hypothetical protein
MKNAKKILPLIVLSAMLTLPACSSYQAEATTNDVTADTGSTVGSVLGAVGSVVMYPFHLVGDLFS